MDQDTRKKESEYLLAMHLKGIFYKEKVQDLFQELDQKIDRLAKMLLKKELKKFLQLAQETREKHASIGAVLIDIFDERYPALLKEIHDPPMVLFCRGNIDLFSKLKISIVGTRKPSPLGIRWANFITDQLSKKKMTIVSGMAEGIDSTCHRAAYMEEAGTIGVLAHGLDWVYPKSNYDLFSLAKSEKKQNVLLITEYPLKTMPKRYYFPQRNRIISGISDSLIFIEGGIKSGALITCRYALEQGREVFALKHSLLKNNAGGERLIEEGAVNLADHYRVNISDQIQHKTLLKMLKQKRAFYLGNNLWAKFNYQEETS